MAYGKIKIDTIETSTKTVQVDDLATVSGGGVTDGDKGDITVSSGGTVWSIDAGVVGTTELGGDITTAGKALLDDADAAAQRTTLGLATVAGTGSYSDLSGTPSLVTALDGLSDVTLNSPADQQVLKYDAATSQWINAAAPGGGGGTVTSVGFTSPTGFSVSGSPVTTSGTIALSYDTGYQGYTSAEASKLSGIEAGAQVNVATDLSYTASSRLLASSTGTDVTLPEATTTLAGLQSAADKTKLDGIASGATANATDSQLRDRATHTGTQDVSTVTGLGGAATLSVGTTAGTVAAGDDSRITEALSVTAAAAAYQPLDSDLTSIAALTTTSFGRDLLTQADGAATRTTIGAGTSNVALSSSTPQPLGTAAAGATGQAADAGHIHASPALDDLSDVVITTPANGEALVYDGTNWVNDTISGGGGSATPAGDAGEIQINDGATPAGLGAVPGFGYDTTADVLNVPGDINLDDGGTYETTLQLVTPTANRTISLPDSTGTVALVAGSTGQVTYNDAGVNAGGNLVYDKTAGTFGYGAGGGTVTQATNKTTGVTLSTSCGTIVMNGAALAADTTATFVLTNTSIAADDMVLVSHSATGTFGAYTLNGRAAAGSASIDVRNVSTGSLSEAIVIRFAVIKATTT